MNTELPSHAVKALRFFYGPQKLTSIVFAGTHEECAEFVQKSDSQIYYLAHNESDRWTLKIVTINSLKGRSYLNALDAAIY
jgi:hypothetical protein